jgi:hypothetical protein
MGATEILNYLAFSPFEQAIEITREFDSWIAGEIRLYYRR